MAKDSSISVGDHYAGFIEAQVSEGRYDSASDVVQAGLRLLEAQEAELAYLRAEIQKGEDSGLSERNIFDIWEDVKSKHGL
jgi:antitoxin ParD1/3/4